MNYIGIYYIRNLLSLYDEKGIDIFSFVACSLGIAWNKQWMEHNNLALKCWENLKGAHERFKSLMGKNLDPKWKP